MDGGVGIPSPDATPPGIVTIAADGRPQWSAQASAVVADPLVDDAADRAAQQRGDPEQPQLADRTAAGEERHGSGAGRVHRGVGDRDADQVDQGQREADRQRREAGRCLAMGGPHDHDQEHRSEHHFAQESGCHAVAPGRQRAVAVAGKCTGLAAINGEATGTGGDLQQDEARQQAAGDLGDDVGHQVLGREAATGPQTDADRRIEMRAGDVAERIGAGHHSQAEGQRHAEESDTQRIAVTAELGGQHRAAAATQNQPERAEELGGQAFTHAHVLHSFDGESVIYVTFQ
ncbi:hypothetical protein G6F65_015275 [Rhizopus arrhizus]|nr:hypothetical protein G6F65_015275 [Rhizopus arrhizus]